MWETDGTESFTTTPDTGAYLIVELKTRANMGKNLRRKSCFSFFFVFKNRAESLGTSAAKVGCPEPLLVVENATTHSQPNWVAPLSADLKRLEVFNLY